MPMSRFEIRNEYGLADPVLYQAADKDDPEDVLEGVAMAGLVGLLRQLGDLAEFAAEIFYNLHDEVMATASRGHSLIIRVQQLEAEVPFIEKAFLSQMDYSSLFNNAGVDWHPQIRLEHNLVSNGDIPRFIMDSCEGCRGPPRLFLLDKFDVAGAGACLKRYTDPSFFKVENTGISGTVFQKEKKIRKVKKRGPYGTNGETPEVAPTSHTKLRELFQEETDKNVNVKHSHRAKLKRRLNGFPFDTKAGNSYMEKILNSPAYDHGVTRNSSSLWLSANDHQKLRLEVLEVRSVSPDNNSVRRKNGYQPSIDRKEIFVNSSAYESSELYADDSKISRATESYSVAESPSMPSNLDVMAGEKVIGIDGESHVDRNLDGYESDGIASEIDSYADAHSTIDSDLDLDSDLRMQNEFTFPNMKTLPVISHADENHPLSRSSDSLSPEDSRISDDASVSSKKNICPRPAADSPSTSGENTSGYNAGKESYFPKIGDDIFQMDRQSNPVLPVLPDETYNDAGVVLNHISSFEQPTSAIKSNGHVQTEPDSVLGTRKYILEDIERCYTSDDEPKETAADTYPRCSLEAFNFHLQAEDGFTTFSNGEYGVDEPTGESLLSISTENNIQLQATEASFSKSLNLDTASGLEYPDMIDEIASSSNIAEVQAYSPNYIHDAVHSMDTNRLNAEFVKLSNSISGTADNEDNVFETTISEGESDFDMLDDEVSLVSADSPVCFPCTVDIFSLRGNDDNAKVDAADTPPGSSSINLHSDLEDAIIFSDPSKSLNRSFTGIDSSEGSSFSKHETSVNEASALMPSEHCEVLQSHDVSVKGSGAPSNLGAQLRSHETSDNADAGTSDIEFERFIVSMNSKEHEVTEIQEEAKPVPSVVVHAFSSGFTSVANESESADFTFDVSVISDEGVLDHSRFNNSYIDEKSIIEDQEIQTTNLLWSGDDNDDHRVEAPNTLPNLCLDEADHGTDFVYAPVEHSLFGNEEVESVLQEKDAPEFSKLNEEMLRHGEVSAELPHLSPFELTPALDICDHMVENNGVSTFSVAENLPSALKLPVLDGLPYPVDASNAIFSVSSPSFDSSQVNIADLPPLPPLPPVQWRMGKIQLPSSSTNEDTRKSEDISLQSVPPHNASTGDVIPSLLSTSSDIGSSLLTTSREEPIVPQLIETTDDIGYPVPASRDNIVSSPLNSCADDIVTSGLEIIEPHTETTSEEIKQSEIKTSNEEILECLIETFIEEIKESRIESSHEEINHSSMESLSGNMSREEKVENASRSEANVETKNTFDLLPIMENKQHQLEETSGSDSIAHADENGEMKANKSTKQPLPRNPLMDDLAALDKSKLRKVGERVRPELKKLDERDSFLQQIRTKSFNLRPATPSRPSVRGPNTNLRVAAILEKANAIRQALTGSDEEDDDDTWSDS